MFHREQQKRDIPKSFESILYIVQEKLGDGFLTLPFIYELHRKFPHTKITILASKYNYKLFEALSFIEELLIYRQDHKLLSEKLRSRKYDIFFNPKDHPSMTILRMMKRVKADIKIGLNHFRHNKHFNILLENDENMHIVEKNALLLKHYGLSFPLKNDIQLIDNIENEFYSKKDKSALKNNISINLSSGGILRKLPVEKWVEVIEYIFSKNLSKKINLLAMPENQAEAEQIKSRFPDKINYPIPTKDIYEAGVVIKNSSLLVSPDTALVHVAAAVKTPIIGLYQNKGLNMKRFSPYNATCEIVLSPDREIGNIKVDQITAAIQKYEDEDILH